MQFGLFPHCQVIRSFWQRLQSGLLYGFKLYQWLFAGRAMRALSRGGQAPHLDILVACVMVVIARPPKKLRLT